DHQFDRLVDVQTWSGVGGDLFDTGVEFKNFPVAEVTEDQKVGDLTGRGIGGASGTHYPSTLHASMRGRGLELPLLYQPGLLAAEVAVRVLDSFTTVLEGFVAGDRRLGELDLLPRPQRARLLRDWGETGPASPWDPAVTVPELVAEQARRTPEAVAVVCADSTSPASALTYAELDARANRLARRLVELGVGPERLVGVLLGKTPDLVESGRNDWSGCCWARLPPWWSPCSRSCGPAVPTSPSPPNTRTTGSTTWSGTPRRCWC